MDPGTRRNPEEQRNQRDLNSSRQSSANPIYGLDAKIQHTPKQQFGCRENDNQRSDDKPLVQRVTHAGCGMHENAG